VQGGSGYSDGFRTLGPVTPEDSHRVTEREKRAAQESPCSARTQLKKTIQCMESKMNNQPAAGRGTPDQKGSGNALRRKHQNTTRSKRKIENKRECGRRLRPRLTGSREPCFGSKLGTGGLEGASTQRVGLGARREWDKTRANVKMNTNCVPS